MTALEPRRTSPESLASSLDFNFTRHFKLRSSVKRAPPARPADVLIRTVAALAAEKLYPSGDAAYLSLLDDDAAVRMLVRATTTGANLADDSWAGVLAQAATADFLMSLGPQSAASQIMAQSNQFETVAGSATRPTAIVPGAISGGFVAEGDPLPVVNLSVSSAVLEPKQMAFIAAVSRELAKYSNAEAVIGAAMRESATAVFDAGLFSSDAASDAAPAGLLDGATDLGSTLITDDGDTAGNIAGVMAALAAEVSPVAGGDIVFCAAPAGAVRMNLAVGNRSPYPVYGTAGLTGGTIVAVAPRALAFAVDPRPLLEISQEATLHMDSSPAQIVDSGTTAAPVRSLWQTSMLGIRFIGRVAWGKRAPGAVATMQVLGW